LGCLAFEVLTGKTLFEAANHMALVSQHVSHDGVPPGVAALEGVPGAEALIEAFRVMLRQRPEERASAPSAREHLSLAARSLVGARWPLAADAHAARGAS